MMAEFSSVQHSQLGFELFNETIDVSELNSHILAEWLDRGPVDCCYSVKSCVHESDFPTT